MKKLTALLLAFTLLFGLTVPAFADQNGSTTVKLTIPEPGYIHEIDFGIVAPLYGDTCNYDNFFISRFESRYTYELVLLEDSEGNEVKNDDIYSDKDLTFYLRFESTDIYENPFADDITLTVYDTNGNAIDSLVPAQTATVEGAEFWWTYTMPAPEWTLTVPADQEIVYQTQTTKLKAPDITEYKNIAYGDISINIKSSLEFKNENNDTFAFSLDVEETAATANTELLYDVYRIDPTDAYWCYWYIAYINIDENTWKTAKPGEYTTKIEYSSSLATYDH